MKAWPKLHSIALGVRLLVDDAVGAGRGDQPAAGVGFDVAVQVERVTFGGLNTH